MKSAEKFTREACLDGASALQRLRERPFSDAATVDIEAVDTALKVFADAINILADHDKQAKARRERIQWLPAGNGIYVAEADARHTATGALRIMGSSSGSAPKFSCGTTLAAPGPASNLPLVSSAA